MMMHTKLYHLALVALLLTGGPQEASAQGFLKKVGNAINKGTKELEKVNKKLNELNPNKKNTDKQRKASENVKLEEYTEQELPVWEKKNTPKGHTSNMYEYMDDHKALAKDYCQFRTTASTKTITVDHLNGIQLGYFHDGRAFVHTSANGMMCIDQKGNIIKQWSRGDELTGINTFDGVDYPKFDSGRFIIVEKEEKYKYYGTAVIYDTNFNVIKRIPQVSSVSNFEGGIAIISKYTGKLIKSTEDAYIDINGNEVFPNLSKMANATDYCLQNTDIRPLREGIAAYAVKKDFMGGSLWGFRDGKGNIITQPIYLQVQDFSNGMAAVLVNMEGVNKWGFIDTKGNMVIPPKYTNQPSQFDNCGLAMVCNKDGLCSFINKKGETVSKTYSDITPFYNGHALYTEYLMDGANNNGKWAIHSGEDQTYLIDSKFNIVATLGKNIIHANEHGDNGMHFFKKGYDIINNNKFERYADYSIGTSFTNGQIYLNLGPNGTGLLSQNGDLIIGGLTGYFSEGLAPVNNTHEFSRDSMYAGYVNEKGEWIIQFKENEF